MVHKHPSAPAHPQITNSNKKVYEPGILMKTSSMKYILFSKFYRKTQRILIGVQSHTVTEEKAKCEEQPSEPQGTTPLLHLTVPVLTGE